MRRKNSAPPERGVDAQTITVGGLGTAGGDYKTRVRATTHEGVHSPWTDDVEFTLTDATEGTASDPNLPDTVSNLVIRGMLNAIYVEFDDEFFATDKPLMSHNMGSYEIEVSNVSNAFPATGNVWTTTLGDDDDAGPPNGPTRKFKVPTGDGFICTGMKSTGSGGLEHFVRVRGINSRGSTSSAYSTVASVTLDTDDVSQTAVVIGQDAIYATHVKAGTLTAQELQAGTITAYEISSGQIFASQIQLPAANPGTDGEANEFHATRAFTIDQDGNMWWGDYDTIALAITGAQKSYITAAGNATFIGEISTDTAGNARIVIADNTTGGDVSGGDSDGGYAYVLGYTEQASEAIPGHAVWTDESGIAAGYFVAPRYHSGFNYSGLRLKDNNTTFAEALLVSSAGGWAGLVKGTDAGSTAHADVSFVINAADGAYIYNSADAPSSTTNRLYSLSGSLYWGDDEIGSGSGDVTDVVATTGGGLYSGQSSGPIPTLSLSLLTNLDSTTPVVGDWVAIHDNSVGSVKRVTIQDILDLGGGDLTAVTAGLTSGLSVTSGTGPIPDISLNLGKLSIVATPVVGDKIGIYNVSHATTGYCTIQDILDLGSGDGDVTAVVAAAAGGLYSGNSSGPIPSLSLSLLTNLDSGTLNYQDWVPFHDNSLGSAKRVIAQDIANLSKTTHLTNGGLWQTGSNGTIEISFGNMAQNVLPTASDLLMFYDSSNSGAISYNTLAWFHSVAPQTTVTTNGGLYSSRTSTASGTIKISFGNMVVATPDASDLLMFHDYTTGTVAYASVATMHHMVGNVSTPVTHDFYLSGSRKVQATGNLYMRGGSGANYGVTAWSTGQTDIHYGTGIVLKTSSSGVQINGGTIYPSTNGIQSLGASNYWWNYSFHKKMDFSALPSWSGAGYYMWLRNDDTVTIAGSSERIKKNITTIQPMDALARVKALRPVEFSPKSNSSDLLIDDMWEYERFRGFIAEEAAEVSHEYGVYGWWKSDDPESEDYDKRRPSISSLQDEWTDEEVAAYYDLDEATPHMFDVHAILADSVAAIQALEARIAVLES